MGGADAPLAATVARDGARSARRCADLVALPRSPRGGARRRRRRRDRAVGAPGERYPDCCDLGAERARLLAGTASPQDRRPRRRARLARGGARGPSSKNPRWATAATLALADVVAQSGRRPPSALELVRAARATKLEGVALRAQRTTARIRAHAAELFEPHRLARRRGRTAARRERRAGAPPSGAARALALAGAERPRSARELWIRARAERSSASAATPKRPASRSRRSRRHARAEGALRQRRWWRWNADDDAPARSGSIAR